MENNTYITPDEEIVMKDAIWKATAILNVAAYAFNSSCPDSPIREQADDICNAVLDYIEIADSVVEGVITRRVFDEKESEVA